MARNLSRSAESRRGVTLLELLLALALSVVVLAAIGTAINLYFRMLDIRRTSMEETQVIRIVWQRMANDVRMIVQPNEPDLSGLETAFSNAMQAATKQASAAAASAPTVIGGGGAAGGASGANAGGGAQGQTGGAQSKTGGGAPTGQTGQAGKTGQTGGQTQGQASAGKAGGGATQGNQSSTGGQTAKTGGSAAGTSAGGSASGGGSTSSSTSGSTTATGESTATVGPKVQLIGSATELRFDISRVPRVDQYQGILASSGELSAVDLPSDVKTIAYYLRSQSSADSFQDDPRAVGGEPSTDGYGRGLMRAETDRAVTAYAEEGGGATSVHSVAQLLAEEVVGLGFEYFDGVDWLTEWDSTSSKTLPRAIRVWLSVQPTYGMNEKEIAQSAAGKEVPSTDFYFVISVPTSPLVATPPAETTEATEASTSSTGSTGATP